MYKCNASLLKRTKYHYGKVKVTKDNILFTNSRGVETKINFNNIDSCTMLKGWFIFSDKVIVKTKKGKEYVFKLLVGDYLKTEIDSNMLKYSTLDFKG